MNVGRLAAAMGPNQNCLDVGVDGGPEIRLGFGNCPLKQLQQLLGSVGPQQPQHRDSGHDRRDESAVATVALELCRCRIAHLGRTATAARVDPLDGETRCELGRLGLDNNLE